MVGPWPKHHYSSQLLDANTGSCLALGRSNTDAVLVNLGMTQEPTHRVAATRVDAALVNSLIGVGCGFASLKRVRLRSHVAVQRSLHSASRAV